MLLNIFFSIVSLISGASLPFAFAPFDNYFLAIAAMLLLLISWLKASPNQAMLRGFLFGLGFFSVGINWVYISIHDYGNATPTIAFMATALLVVYLALFPAVTGYFFTKEFPENNLRKFLLAFPGSWVLFEWVRSWLFSGFPWLLLGYSQINSSLQGFVPLIGVYGISFLVAFTAALLVALFYCKRNLFRALLVLVLVGIWVGGFYLSKVDWTLPKGRPVQVSLIQGNVSQEQKWNEKQLENILTTYAKLTRSNWGSKIIVWPEAAVPTFKENVVAYLNTLTKNARRHKATIITGLPIYDKKTAKIYNGVMAMGSQHALYLKKHLVPFGEYLPFKSELNWLHNYFTIPMSDFSGGNKRQPSFIVDNILVAPFVCYEIAYTHLVLSYFPRAQLIITLCDDSWFGKSPAAAQHLEMAQMRSLETGRYQLLGTNTGLTAIINPKGKIIAEAPSFQEAVLTTKIQAMTGSTPWVKFGHYLWLILILVGLWISTLRIGK